MKVLSIGNSFSQDAQRYVHQIAFSNGDDIYCANLFIGGCSLERHYNNIQNDIADYDYQINGNDENCEKISIKSALQRENWDIITVQQVSSYSGMYETYYPYIKDVVAYAKQFCKNAKIYLHQTWSYEQGSGHGDFKNYNNDTDLMFEKIVETNKRVFENEKLDVLIPDGEIINELRKTKTFDYKNGGLSLCRDTFHMSYDFGRYALSLTWYKILTGKSVLNIDYTPPYENKDEDYFKKVDLIKNTVDNYIK